MKLRITIYQDEQSEIDHIKKSILFVLENLQGKYEVEFLIYNKGSEVARGLKKKHISDIYFLDLIPEDTECMLVAKVVHEKYRHPIVFFVSEYKEYVQDAFRVNAFQYIFKPFDEAKFQHEIKVAVQKWQRFNYVRELISMGKNKQHLDLNFLLRPSKILYFESDNKYIFSYIENQNQEIICHKLRKKLDNMEESLKSFGFTRCHKSYLVNMKYFYQMDSENIYCFSHNITIPVSYSKKESARNEVIEFLEKKLATF